MLNILVAGPGLIGTSHIKKIWDCDRTELAGIVSRKASSSKYAAKFRGAQVFDDLDVAISKTKADGVIIATPNETHEKMLQICARKHVPALLEKPALLCRNEYRKVTQNASSEYLDDKVLVGHHRAHSKLIKGANDLISKGALGRLIGFSGKAAFYKPNEYFSSAPWRARPGGGPLMINMIHEIQTMRMLIGEIAAVSGFLSSNNRNFEVEDTGGFSILFDNGVIGTFYLTDTSVSPFSWEMTSGENPSFPHFKDEACYEIFGDKGTLTVPNLKFYSQKSSSRRSWLNPMEMISLTQERDDPLERQLSHFCDVIEGKTKPLVDLNSGMQNVFIVEKIMKNALYVGNDYQTIQLQSASQPNEAGRSLFCQTM